MEDKIAKYTTLMREAGDILREIVTEAVEVPGALFALQQADMFARTGYMWAIEGVMQYKHVQGLKEAAETGDIANKEGMTVVSGGKEVKVDGGAK